MTDQTIYPRYLRPRLIEALADTPVVLIHGPRQCGKTTLAQTLEGYTYITFDDEVQLAAAHADPLGFVADLPNRVILDEVQRIPELFVSLRAAGQTARLFNVSELASPFQLSRPTIRDYVTLLQRIFLLEQVPPWHSNRLSRLIKTPKLHMGDTGLAASLLGVDAAALSEDRNLLASAGSA